MTASDMRSQVRSEMSHIPRWPKLEQRLLRACYWMRRMHSLGRNAAPGQTAAEVLAACVEDVQKAYPAGTVQFDRAFFRTSRLSAATSHI